MARALEKNVFVTGIIISSGMFDQDERQVSALSSHDMHDMACEVLWCN